MIIPDIDKHKLSIIEKLAVSYENHDSSLHEDIVKYFKKISKREQGWLLEGFINWQFPEETEDKHKNAIKIYEWLKNMGVKLH